MTCQLYVQGKQAKDALVGGAFYSRGKQVTPGERRIDERVYILQGEASYSGVTCIGGASYSGVHFTS